MEASTRGDDDDDDGLGDEDSDDTEGKARHFDGVATLGGPTGTKKSSSKSAEGAPAAAGSAPAPAKDGAPPLLNPDLPHLAAVLDKADVVIEVLDARDPLVHRSSALEAHVASKSQKLLLVLNKIGARALNSSALCMYATCSPLTGTS
jgi:nuclear GTP-binding protein